MTYLQMLTTTYESALQRRVKASTLRVEADNQETLASLMDGAAAAERRARAAGLRWAATAKDLELAR